MKYISIDIETTGLDPDYNDILEVGAYIEDTQNPLFKDELPCFHAYVWKDTYMGEAYALAMNTSIFQKILKLKKEKSPLLLEKYNVASAFGIFLEKNLGYNPERRSVLAGKNVAGFDLQFLKRLSGWNNLKFYHRVLDPMMLYFNPAEDEVPPDLSTCKKRAGLPENVSHEALDDAWDVIQLIRIGSLVSYSVFQSTY